MQHFPCKGSQQRPEPPVRWTSSSEVRPLPTILLPKSCLDKACRMLCISNRKTGIISCEVQSNMLGRSVIVRKCGCQKL